MVAGISESSPGRGKSSTCRGGQEGCGENQRRDRQILQGPGKGMSISKCNLIKIMN